MLGVGQQKAIEGQAADGAGRSWLTSWKVWLGVCLPVLVIVAVSVPLVRFAGERAVARALESENVRFQYAVDVLPLPAFSDVLTLLPGTKRPVMVEIRNQNIDSEMFAELGRLPLVFVSIENSTFEPQELAALVERSPGLNQIWIRDGPEIPVNIVRRIEAARPETTLQQQGFALPEAMLINIPGGLEVVVVTATSPQLAKGDVIQAMDGQPLRTYHELQQKVESLQPGEGVRLTVRGVDGTEREEIYTAPQL